MSEPLVLVVLLATSGDPTTEALLGTARRALGPEVTVLAETSAPETDGEALAVADRVHARAIARVTWADASFKVARIHVHVGATSEWSDDEITFRPGDEALEKGRTVGYALATMVQRLEQERLSAEAQAPSVPPAVAPAPAPTPLPVPALATTPSPAAESPPRFPLELFAYGIGVLGGNASAAGGGGGLRYWPDPHVGLRFAAAARAGDFDTSGAEGSTTTVTLAAGPGYRVPIGTFDLGVRTDFVLLRHVVTREAISHARWLGAVDALVELGWSASPRAGLVLAVGSEVAFGATSITVGGVSVGDLPTVRAVAELGARVRF